MPRPQYARAIDFYQAAYQRYEDAEILFDRNRLTGAFYPAGYGVECILKALILSSIPELKRRVETDRSFRGQSGHDIEALRQQYFKVSGRMIQGAASPLSLARVQTWKTDLRYETSVKLSKRATPLSRKQVKAFLEAVNDVLSWADARMNDGSSKAK